MGVDGKTEKSLIMEDISTNKVNTFGKHESAIQTLLYNKMTETLFGGDCSGHVKQYKRGNSKQPFSLVKDYRNVGIGKVFSSAQVGGIAFFGGENHSLVAINIWETRLYKKKIASPFSNNYSIEICHGEHQKVYLSIGGEFPEYSSTVSDFLDITGIYKMQEDSIKLEKKQMQSKKK